MAIRRKPDGTKLKRSSAGHANPGLHRLDDPVQVDMPGYEFVGRVGDPTMGLRISSSVSPMALKSDDGAPSPIPSS